MKQTLLIKNKDFIINKLNQKYIIKRDDLFKIIEDLKSEKLIPQAMSFNVAYDHFINMGLIVHVFRLNNQIIERYSMEANINIHKFAASIKPKSFFSMTTALQLQGYKTLKPNYIFVSSELTPKSTDPAVISQESIDEAYKKPYRMTNNYGEFEGAYIISLSPKNTSRIGVIEYNGYMVSSINRAFVEIIVNMQYFQNSLTVIQLFQPIQSQLDLKQIFAIIEKFNFIYPFYQLFGYLLEQVGFSRAELSDFKSKVANFKFYTDKNKQNYLYDDYWQIFYIK